MWEKLLGLFKDEYADQESAIPASIAKREARKQQLATEASQQPEIQTQLPESEAQGVLIGFNYLKGLDDENNINQPRRFINLNKLLRGEYKDGKTQTPSSEQENILRGEDAKRRL